mmetsp:Transcript_17223/g.27472  ORF Transcript_17223/g.27472 Transcript_17223/m.27472 type:complete len:189 (+) Transcript_17223:77-643(+)
MGAQPSCQSATGIQVVKKCAGELDCADVTEHIPSLNKPKAPCVNDVLLSASRAGDCTVVQTCLAAGADVNVRQPLKLCTLDRFQKGEPLRNCGLTPLMISARGGHARCVAALLKEGALVNEVDEDSVTALHFAAASGDLEIFQSLIVAGARTDAVNEECEGVLDYLPQAVRIDAHLLKQFEEVIISHS